MRAGIRLAPTWVEHTFPRFCIGDTFKVLYVERRCQTKIVQVFQVIALHTLQEEFPVARVKRDVEAELVFASCPACARAVNQ